MQLITFHYPLLNIGYLNYYPESAGTGGTYALLTKKISKAMKTPFRPLKFGNESEELNDNLPEEIKFILIQIDNKDKISSDRGMEKSTWTWRWLKKRTVFGG